MYKNWKISFVCRRNFISPRWKFVSENQPPCLYFQSSVPKLSLMIYHFFHFSSLFVFFPSSDIKGVSPELQYFGRNSWFFCHYMRNMGICANTCPYPNYWRMAMFFTQSLKRRSILRYTNIITCWLVNQTMKNKGLERHFWLEIHDTPQVPNILDPVFP